MHSPKDVASEIPTIVAPVTVVAPQEINPAPATTTLEEDRDGVSRRWIAERSSAKTTEEEDRKTASQREINKKWEDTQAKIATWVVGSSLIVGSILGLFGTFLSSSEIQLAAIVFLFGVANLVTGFYFGRTNHQRSGGVGGEFAGPR